MKKFLYFESQEGGMDVFPIRSESDFRQIRSWMDPMVRKSDERLLKWWKTAKVGEYIHHRLGTLVRVKK